MKKTNRPWGSFTILEETDFYKVKRIQVSSGEVLSLQKHKHRTENWTVVKGIATVINGGAEFQLKISESTFIPRNTLHRLENKENEELIIIETQTGSYLGEDDIERIEDIYGRKQ